MDRRLNPPFHLPGFYFGVTLPPTNIAAVGGYLEEGFPLSVSVSMLVGGRVPDF